jgi:hypothetical protein
VKSPGFRSARAFLPTAILGLLAPVAAPVGPAVLADPAGSGPALPAEETAFPAPLGSYSTTLIGSHPARTQNIRLAVRALDGAVLLPGEVLSYNAVVGPRETARGYLPAPAILHEMRQVQTGGGICQAASTVFVAGLLSGLGVEERWRHSSPVDYIALGEDATIAWGAKDLRLRNDLPGRVRLRVEVLGSTLSARFEAEEAVGAGFELETIERELPAGGADGLEAPGREIEVYRVRTVEGRVVDRELLHRDVYPPSRRRDGEEPRR